MGAKTFGSQSKGAIFEGITTESAVHLRIPAAATAPVRRAQSDLFCRPAREDETSFSLSSTRWREGAGECRCLRLRPGNLIRRTPDGEHADPFLLLLATSRHTTYIEMRASTRHTLSECECSQDVTFRLDPSSSIGAANSSTHTR